MLFEDFATLTIDRGDRPQLFAFCEHQLDKLSPAPKHKIFVTEPPTSNSPDIIKRMKMGITAAKNLGIDILYVVESDDFYPPDFVNQMWIGTHDFIGSSKTLYYHIGNKTYEQLDHPGRSSLFCTAFRISALDKFEWPAEDTVFLDIDLWKYAVKRGNYKLLDEPIGVGIKHGIGKTGGSGHRRVFAQNDENNAFLKSKVDREAYAFYMSL